MSSTAAAISEPPKTRRNNPEQEAALDEKIRQIERKNRALEERLKLAQNDAQQHALPKLPPTKEAGPASTSNKSLFKDKSQNKNDKNSDTKKSHVWSREWDSGKIPAEKWNQNVPEIQDSDRNNLFQNDKLPNKHKGKYTANFLKTTHLSGVQESNSKRMDTRAAKPSSRNAPTKPPGFFHDDRFETLEEKTKSDKNPKIAKEQQELPAAIRNKKIASRITIVREDNSTSDASSSRNSHKMPAKNASNNLKNFQKNNNIKIHEKVPDERRQRNIPIAQRTEQNQSSQKTKNNTENKKPGRFSSLNKRQHNNHINNNIRRKNQETRLPNSAAQMLVIRKLVNDLLDKVCLAISEDKFDKNIKPDKLAILKPNEKNLETSTENAKKEPGKNGISNVTKDKNHLQVSCQEIEI